MPNMKVTIDALKQAGVRDNVKIIVGGAPLTDAYASEIGADGYASDASKAVKLARSFIA
jgi:5-methyltetrahydrofolate--homocysteine methyltransferase